MITAKDRVGVEIHEGDFLIYVTAGDRHPVLEFGYVVKFHEVKAWNGTPSGNVKIKIQRSTPDGVRQTKQAVDVASHWREDTPEHIKDYYSGYRRTQEEYDKYYVQTTYLDTGKPDTTMLDISTKSNNNRMLVSQPI